VIEVPSHFVESFMFDYEFVS